MEFTEKSITQILAAKHAGDDWAFFAQMPTVTGGEKKNYIDAYAVGLWNQNRGAIAYEIKISRSDFKHDVEQFTNKQQAAMNASSQFFYVVPSGLVQPSEVPDQAGLIFVSETGSLKTMKIAPLRELNAVSFDFLRSVARQSSETTRQKTADIIKFVAKHPDFSIDDIDEYILTRYKKQRDWDILLLKKQSDKLGTPQHVKNFITTLCAFLGIEEEELLSQTSHDQFLMLKHLLDSISRMKFSVLGAIGGLNTVREDIEKFSNKANKTAQ